MVAAIKASAEGKRLIEWAARNPSNSRKKVRRGAATVARDRGPVRGGADARQPRVSALAIGRAGESDRVLQPGVVDQAGGQRPWGEGETLNNIAAATRPEAKEQALEYYNRALPFRRAGADRAAEAATLGNIRLTYSSLGDMQRAIEYYRQSLRLWRAAGRRDGETNALIGLGQIHGYTGENQQALDYLNQGLSISRGINDRRGEAFALLSIGKIQIDLGEHEKALDDFANALDLFRPSPTAWAKPIRY